MSGITHYKKFNFQRNKWLHQYLQNYALKNNNVKTLNDVKEYSINILETVFRKNGFGYHNRENWIKCAEQIVCSGECRNSNGFKNTFDRQYNKNKCVPITRKFNPYLLPKDGWKYNKVEQYAYNFLKSYNSIIYTLNTYNNNDLTIDNVLNKLSSYNKNSSGLSVYDINNVYDTIHNQEMDIFKQKVEKLYPETKIRKTELLYSKPIVKPTYGEFDKAYDKMKNNNFEGGKKRTRKFKKSRKNKKLKKNRKTKKKNKKMSRKYN